MNTTRRIRSPCWFQSSICKESKISNNPPHCQHCMLFFPLRSCWFLPTALTLTLSAQQPAHTQSRLFVTFFLLHLFFALSSRRINFMIRIGLFFLLLKSSIKCKLKYFNDKHTRVTHDTINRQIFYFFGDQPKLFFRHNRWYQNMMDAAEQTTYRRNPNFRNCGHHGKERKLPHTHTRMWRTSRILRKRNEPASQRRAEE